MGYLDRDYWTDDKKKSVSDFDDMLPKLYTFRQLIIAVLCSAGLSALITALIIYNL